MASSFDMEMAAASRRAALLDDAAHDRLVRAVRAAQPPLPWYSRLRWLRNLLAWRPMRGTSLRFGSAPLETGCARLCCAA